MFIEKKHLDNFEIHYDPEKMNLEETFKILRESGAGQMTCVKLLMIELDYTIKDVGNYVLNCNTWSDVVNENQEFRANLKNAIDRFE